MSQQKDYFYNFKQLCISILSESDNCKPSQQAFQSATTVQQLVHAWEKYWSGIIHEVPQQVKDAFTQLYSVYKADINRAGLWYNEQPQTGGYRALVLIGDATPETAQSAVDIMGNHRIYIIGSQSVRIFGTCRAFISSRKARVELFGSVDANIEKGEVKAREFSRIHGKGTITSYDSAVVDIYGGTCEDHGHYEINAYNDSVVTSFTSRKIKLHGKARLESTI